MSWYKTEQKFTVKQKKYFLLLEKVFRIADAKGVPMDYKPLDYQKEMHSVVPLACPEKEWKNVWTYKGRGIGASRVRMMDMIIHCLNYPGIVFPILIHRQETGIEWINVAKELIKTSKIDLESEVKKPYNKMEIEFKTGSKIKLFPSTNVDALRSIRTIFVILDELEFFRDIKGVLAAINSCMNQGGVGVFQSTVRGRTSHFWETRERFLKDGVTHGIMQNYPVFDPEKFEPNTPIQEQIKRGIEPIGFWYNIDKLEEERVFDTPIFMQENQIVPISDSDSWYPFNLVMSCVDENLTNSEFFTTINPVYIGIDFGRNHDFTSISIFEKTEFGFVQRYQKFLKKMSMPDQRVFIEGLINNLKPTKVRTDQTGMGIGITEELQKKFGSVVEGINFTKPSKEKMATNLKVIMSDVKITLINDNMLIKHLASVNYELKSVRDKDEGHSDAAWSIALGVLPDIFDLKNVQIPAALGRTKNMGKRRTSETPYEFIQRARNNDARKKIEEVEAVIYAEDLNHNKICKRLKVMNFFCLKRKETVNRYYCANCGISDCSELQATKNLIKQGGEEYETFKERENRDDSS